MCEVTQANAGKPGQQKTGMREYSVVTYLRRWTQMNSSSSWHIVPTTAQSCKKPSTHPLSYFHITSSKSLNLLHVILLHIVCVLECMALMCMSTSHTVARISLLKKNPRNVTTGNRLQWTNVGRTYLYVACTLTIDIHHNLVIRNLLSCFSASFSHVLYYGDDTNG